MKSYRKVIEVNIPSRMAFLNITPQVNALSTVWILIVLTAVFLLQRLQSRESK